MPIATNSSAPESGSGIKPDAIPAGDRLQKRALPVDHPAALVDEPQVARIHSERQYGSLQRFDWLPFPDLLVYFRLRRILLLGVALARELFGAAQGEVLERGVLDARADVLHELDPQTQQQFPRRFT